MKKLAHFFRDHFDHLGQIDYGVFIVFFIITMLFVLTVIKNI